MNKWTSIFFESGCRARFTKGLFSHELGDIAKTTSITGNFHDT